MKLTKEECIKALNVLKEQHDYLSFNLHSNYPYSIEMIKEVQSCFEQLINEHFDNPPLKFEELKVGMWVWDKHFNRFGEYLKIYKIEVDEFGQKLIIASCVHCEKFMTRSYLENRFYRYEVQDETN